MIDGTRKQITINLFDDAISNDESRFFCLTLFVFRVRGVTINAVSFVAIVDVIVVIITVDVDFFAIVIDVNDIGVTATAISADCVSLVFVIGVIIFDVAVGFANNDIANNFFDIEIIVIIIFVVADFTAIIIDFNLLAAVGLSMFMLSLLLLLSLLLMV